MYNTFLYYTFQKLGLKGCTEVGFFVKEFMDELLKIKK
jgi:hypothetical protein